MLPLVLFNLFWLCVVVAGTVAVAVNWLSRRRAQRDAVPGARPRDRGHILAVSILCIGLGSLILFNVSVLSGPAPAASTVTPVHVTGTWRGMGGATLVLRPDGTFTGTGLPAGIGWVSPAGDRSDSANPASVQGTWTINPGPSGSAVGVTFCYDRRTDPDSCRQFGLQVLHARSSPMLLAHLSGPGDFHDQYAFSRQPG